MAVCVLNPRAEVPVLVDGSFTVTDSTDIVYYLEDRFPTPAVLPVEPELRAKARRWQRVADTLLDAIIHDISIWTWPTHERPDEPPEGLLQAGRGDLRKVVTQLEDSLDAGGFVCGDLSIADFALFPHISALKPLGILLEESTHPRLLHWNREMRSQAPVRKTDVFRYEQCNNHGNSDDQGKSVEHLGHGKGQRPADEEQH